MNRPESAFAKTDAPSSAPLPTNGHKEDPRVAAISQTATPTIAHGSAMYDV